jgi:hypothetical protein
MFGSKRREIQRLRAVLKEDGEFIETSRTIAEKVRRLPDENPEEYDALVKSAFDDVAKREAIKLEAAKQARNSSFEAEEASSLSGAGMTNGEAIKLGLNIGSTLGGAVGTVSFGTGMIIDIVAQQNIEKIGACGALTAASTYLAIKGIKRIFQYAREQTLPYHASAPTQL